MDIDEMDIDKIDPIKPKLRSLKWYRARVKVLRAKPQHKQKSIGWYQSRNLRVTASEASCCLPKIKEVCQVYENLFNVKIKYNPDKCLNTYDTLESYIINKCRTFYGENLFQDNKYTLHGKKYEEISTRLYRQLYKTDVIEFGLLPHPRLSYLGASPDGITPDGMMLEIKNPNSMYTIPSMTYFLQMQLQMECADLDECDFLVCLVKEITEQEFNDFIPDMSSNNTPSDTPFPKQFKGIVLNKIKFDDNNTEKYIYPPDHLINPEDYFQWATETIDTYKLQNIVLLPNFYVIKEWHIQRISRNREWFNSIKHYFKDTMDLIRKLQSDREVFDKYWNECKRAKSKVFHDTFHATQLHESLLFDDNESLITILDDTEVEVALHESLF
jgi:hypothetical protein